MDRPAPAPTRSASPRIAIAPDVWRDTIRSADLPTVLERLGVELVTRGGSTWARCWTGKHPDQHHSVQLNLNQEKQTYHCYSCRNTGDVLSAVCQRNGLDHTRGADAVRGFGILQDMLDGRGGHAPLPKAAPRAVIAGLSMDAQVDAVSHVLKAIDAAVPDASQRAGRYLADRGLPAEAVRIAHARLFDRADIQRIERALDLSPDGPIAAAGLTRTDRMGRQHLLWWDTVCLGVCTTAAGDPGFLWARRTDTSQIASHVKYLNQSVRMGASWLPFNGIAIDDAAASGRPLRVVEGPLTALGSQCIPGASARPTMAMLGRIGYTKQGDGRQSTFWSQVDLTGVSELELSPDYDPVEQVRLVGQQLADQVSLDVAGRYQGMPVTVSTIRDHGHTSGKDWLDACAKQRGLT